MKPWERPWESWPCVCNRGDRTYHAHYRHRDPKAADRCARCGDCTGFRPDIPEDVAIALLIGVEMTEAHAADILLGCEVMPQHAKTCQFERPADVALCGRNRYELRETLPMIAAVTCTCHVAPGMRLDEWCRRYPTNA